MAYDFKMIDSHLLSHPGTSKAFHEKWGWMVYWVGGKQFACEFTAKLNAKEPTRGATYSRSNAIPTASSSSARNIQTQSFRATTRMAVHGFPSISMPTYPTILY